MARYTEVENKTIEPEPPASLIGSENMKPSRPLVAPNGLRGFAHLVERLASKPGRSTPSDLDVLAPRHKALSLATRPSVPLGLALERDRT